MRQAGVRVGVFNHLGLGRRWLGIVPRDHRKLLVVDDAAGVISGVGIGHEWTRGSRKSHGQPWRDTAIRIAGPAAVDMRAAFERMWARIERPGRRDKDATRPTRRRPHEDEPAVVGIVEGEPGRFRIARGLQIQAALADRSIWVADAYFVPSFAEVEALTGAARDGVDVRLLVPSRADHNWTIGLTRRYYRRLLRNGVRIWEWQGEMMHAKTSVVDGLAVRVGSTDFNPLGVAINFELDALVRDEGAGAAAEAMFLDDLDASREVQLVDGRPVV
jgi:cardiolipin synthase